VQAFRGETPGNERRKGSDEPLIPGQVEKWKSPDNALSRDFAEQ
jgi:hypothetical protein